MGATLIVFAPLASATVPPVMVAVVAALLLVAVTGLLLERVRVPPVPMVTVGAASPPLLFRVMLARLFVVAAVA